MATAATGLGAPGLALRWLSETLRQRGLLFAIFIILVIGVLVIPMPSFLLDVGLAISITLSTLILLVAIMTRRALDFSSFPTVLLVATMIRLTLNLSSTRLILTNGHAGTHAAGQIIEAFGTLLMGGNFVIGIVVFVILAIVSLVVVNKGSGRIAEVAARFSLDAMPGKQMAIDADLSAGLIDEAEARRRRKDLEDESAFYGAMDGASKFVKGDAIAGMLIMIINIVGGLIIGVAQHGLSFTAAAQTYTILTVGDGLVAAIPSILVSVGAGMLVSKAGGGAPAGEALAARLSASPKALATVAALLVGLGLTPGMPLLPFFGLAAILGGAAWKLPKLRAAQEAREREASERQEKEKTGTPAQQLAAELRFDPVRLELGIGVSSVVMAGADSLSQRVMELRRPLPPPLRFRAADRRDPPEPDAAAQHLRPVPAQHRGRARRAHARPLPRHEPERGLARHSRPGYARARLRPAGSLDRCRPARTCRGPWLRRRRQRHRHHRAPHGDGEGEHGGAIGLRGHAEAACRNRHRAPEARRRSRAEPAVHEHRAARAAVAPGRAGVDPRSARHPRRPGRGGGVHARSAGAGCPRARPPR